jgi:hypothetical protein
MGSDTRDEFSISHAIFAEIVKEEKDFVHRKNKKR